MPDIARSPLSQGSRCFTSIRSTCGGTTGCRTARCSRCCKACAAGASWPSISTEWRRALLNSPWVADASLRRTLPSTVDVVILERAPLGIGRINGSLYLVDDRGAVIDEYGPNYADLDLPIIDGLSSAPGEEDAGRVSRDARAAAARCAARAEHGGADFADRRQRRAERGRAARRRSDADSAGQRAVRRAAPVVSRARAGAARAGAGDRLRRSPV